LTRYQWCEISTFLLLFLLEIKVFWNEACKDTLLTDKRRLNLTFVGLAKIVFRFIIDRVHLVD
jgi:hypothetical protein